MREIYIYIYIYIYSLHTEYEREIYIYSLHTEYERDIYIQAMQSKTTVIFVTSSIMKNRLLVVSCDLTSKFEVNVSSLFSREQLNPILCLSV